MLNAQNADVYTDFNSMAKLKDQARKDSPAALKEVAKQFESLFLTNILKGMRAAKLADGAMDNEQSKFYTDMYDQQLAVHLSGSPGIGLADLIVKQLSPAKPKTEKQDIEDYLNKSVGVSSAQSPIFNGGSNKMDASRGKIGLEEIAPPFKDVGVGEIPEGQIQLTPYTAASTQKLEQAIEALPGSSLEPITGKRLSTGDQSLPIQSAEEFVRRLHPLAVQAGQELGVEPKVLLAQAALESGWGRSTIKNGNGDNSFNLFNIKADKAWQGKQAQLTTLEFDQGIPKKVNAGFRSYGSFQESFKDYVGFIKSNPRYGDALKKSGNAEQYMNELQRAGYATDPKYADKVMSIYQGNTMSDFEPDVITAMNQ